MYPQDKCGRCKRFIALQDYNWRPEISFSTWNGEHKERHVLQVCAKCERGWSITAQAFIANVTPEDLLDLCTACHQMREGVEPIYLAIGHGVQGSMSQCCPSCRARVYDTMREVGLG